MIKFKIFLLIPVMVFVSISHGINISGTVINMTDSPIKGAYVFLEKSGQSATTTTNGEFVLAGAVNVNDKITKHKFNDIPIIIKNGLLCVNATKKTYIEILTYNLSGKIVYLIQKNVDAGQSYIPLKNTGAGLYLHKVKYENNILLIKSCLSEFIIYKTYLSVPNKSQKKMANFSNYSPIEDVISVSKQGYLDSRVMVTKSVESGVKIKILPCADSVTDADGNIYQAVKIGNQVWTTVNLRTTKYNDGNPIPHSKENSAWVNDSLGAYCFYDNTTDADSIRRYGGLYNWHSVITKKLAPTGWHVPTKEEWNTLQNYLIGNGFNWDETITGNKITKSLSARANWKTSTEQGSSGNEIPKNNNTGFSAYPGGSRMHTIGFFGEHGANAFWWSATKQGEWMACLYYISHSRVSLNEYYYVPRAGYSIRLIRD